MAFKHRTDKNYLITSWHIDHWASSIQPSFTYHADFYKSPVNSEYVPQNITWHINIIQYTLAELTNKKLRYYGCAEYSSTHSKIVIISGSSTHKEHLNYCDNLIWNI